MIEIIKEEKEWSEQLSFIGHVDFYHTYDYHQLSKEKDETPVLIKYTEGATTLLLPLLFRSIENSIYQDATSVYGYAGALAVGIDEDFKQEDFNNELNALFREHKIVSVFSRLNPYIDHQEATLGGLGTITELGKVVYIDLDDTLENQRKMFNKRMKTYLNKSRRSCTVIESKLDSHLDRFIELYHENMRRVDANESYFFDSSYFYRLMASTDFNTKLMLCIENETQTIIGGAFFIEKGNIVQYHLSGLDEYYFDLQPIKLIIDEMRIKSTTGKFKFLNLGGGRGSNEDSLFSFKSSFSKNFKEFKIWKHIVDENIYDMLVEKHFGMTTKTDISDSGYFPAYRQKISVTA